MSGHERYLLWNPHGNISPCKAESYILRANIRWLPTAKAFGGTYRRLTSRTAEMLRQDLEAAGVAYVDEGGRVLDFHGLRHTFVTNLSHAPKIANKRERPAQTTLLSLTRVGRFGAQIGRMRRISALSFDPPYHGTPVPPQQRPEA